MPSLIAPQTGELKAAFALYLGVWDKLLLREGEATLPETNSHVAPENGWDWKTIRLPFGAKGLFFREELLVSGRVGGGFGRFLEFLPRNLGK